VCAFIGFLVSEFILNFFVVRLWEQGPKLWVQCFNKIAEDMSTVIVGFILSGVLIGYVQDVIQVKNVEIGSLLLFNQHGITDSQEQKETEADIRKYKDSIKFRRFRKVFSLRILWWWACSLLYFLGFWTQIATQGKNMGPAVNNLFCSAYYMCKIV
jgi:hypothetical protein